jgi:uncharacterized pyridoxal phosphate-dependent enzyme
MSSSVNFGNCSRRSFLRWSQSAMALLGAAPFLGTSSEASTAPASPAASADDYYAKLGVRKMINAAGTYTVFTAAVMPPKVQRAVAQAALHPVYLRELQTRSGEYLATKLRCEGAVVTCGASSAITLATAACIAYANNLKPDQIPQDVGAMKNEVIVQKAHRYGYDHAIFLCGAKIVEVVTLDDYKRAFNSKTVMTNFFNAADGGEIGHKEWLEVAHEHNVPCHIDAAADMPPISNLWKYTGMGFDLVCFSGGKGIRGPQNAGLLLGKKHLTDLAGANDNPNEGVGRGMKVAKEQIVGMVAAVDYLLEQSDEVNEREYTRRANVISRIVKDVPTMKSSIFIPEVANHVPHLMLTYDPAVVGLTPKQVQERLRSQNPSIELNPSTGSIRAGGGMPAGPNTIVVGTWMLQPGEAEIVGHQLRAVLMQTNS